MEIQIGRLTVLAGVKKNGSVITEWKFKEDNFHQKMMRIPFVDTEQFIRFSQMLWTMAESLWAEETRKEMIYGKDRKV